MTRPGWRNWALTTGQSADKNIKREGSLLEENESGGEYNFFDYCCCVTLSLNKTELKILLIIIC